MKNQTSNAIITDLENAEDIKFGKRDQKAFESLKANIDKGMAKPVMPMLLSAVPCGRFTMVNTTALKTIKISQSLHWMSTN